MTTPPSKPGDGSNVTVLLPVFNDWASSSELLKRIDTAFALTNDRISVVFVDDGSSETPPPDFTAGPFQKLENVACVFLKKNVGHQRALAIGLCHILQKIPTDIVVLMDSDGEDEPADARRLVRRVQESNGHAIVFAERTRRSENFTFKVSYFFYRMLHYVLVGKKIKFGNFSAVPAKLLPNLTVDPMIWNHYAATVVSSRIPIDVIKTVRGYRIAGKSNLNFVNLVVHGLSALACYNEIIGVRVLLFMTLPSAIAAIGIATVIGLKLFTTWAISGWASTISILFAILLLQMVTFITNFVMQTIATRTVQPFLPIRDYVWFVGRVVVYYPPPAP